MKPTTSPDSLKYSCWDLRGLHEKSPLHRNTFALDCYKSGNLNLFQNSANCFTAHSCSEMLSWLGTYTSEYKSGFQGSKCLPGLATLKKCPSQTTCKSFPQQRKYFAHTADLNLCASSWFWFHAKQLRNTLYSDCVRAVLQNILGMNLSSTGTSKISPGAWVDFGEAEQKLLCCHTCTHLTSQTFLCPGEAVCLSADTVLPREGDQNRWWEKSWAGRTLIRYLFLFML